LGAKSRKAIRATRPLSDGRDGKQPENERGDEMGKKMASDDKKTLFQLALIFVFVLLGAAGYIQNIIALFGMKEVNGEAIVRTIGVFMVPVGAIYGWF